MGYILSHWRGEQPLIKSFWVNLVGLRLLVLFFDRFTHPPFTEQTMAALMSTVVYIAVFHVGFFIWQAVGLLRACDTYLRDRGSSVVAWSAQLGLVGCLLFTLVSGISAFQAHLGTPHETLVRMRLDKQKPVPRNFTLRLSDDKTRIHLTGDLSIGISGELVALLNANPKVTGIVLVSDGGYVNEGRSLALLFKERGLETYVYEECSSACTTAFIGGRRRYLGKEGKLGFHQYGVVQGYQTSYFKPEDEQKIDQEFFRQQNIAADFIAEIFQADHASIWFPELEKLYAAGVAEKVQPDR